MDGPLEINGKFMENPEFNLDTAPTDVGLRLSQCMIEKVLLPNAAHIAETRQSMPGAPGAPGAHAFTCAGDVMMKQQIASDLLNSKKLYLDPDD